MASGAAAPKNKEIDLQKLGLERWCKGFDCIVFGGNVCTLKTYRPRLCKSNNCPKYDRCYFCRKYPKECAGMKAKMQ